LKISNASPFFEILDKILQATSLCAKYDGAEVGKVGGLLLGKFEIVGLELGEFEVVASLHTEMNSELAMPL